MLRQLNERRQVTLPSKLASHVGLRPRSWVEVHETNGKLMLEPVEVTKQGTRSLELTDEEWKRFNRRVEEELHAGRAKVYRSGQGLLVNLKRRMKR